MIDSTSPATGTVDDGLPVVPLPDGGPDGTPVFVDETGARHRRARVVMALASALCLAFIGLVVLGLTGSGPLSGSPILAPVRGALDDLGIPHPSSTGTTAPPTPSGTAAAQPTGGPSAPTGSSRPTSPAGGAVTPTPRPSTTPQPTVAPTGATPSPTGPRPTTRPTKSANPGSTHRATPSPNPGNSHRATPSPKPTR